MRPEGARDDKQMGFAFTAPLQGATVITIHEPGVETTGYIT
jgi:hypothetical protein